jgi:hypothetical protein
MKQAATKRAIVEILAEAYERENGLNGYPVSAENENSEEDSF